MLIKWNTFTYNVCMSAHEQKHKNTNTLNNNGDSHVQIKHFVKFKSQYNMHRTYSWKVIMCHRVPEAARRKRKRRNREKEKQQQQQSFLPKTSVWILNVKRSFGREKETEKAPHKYWWGENWSNSIYFFRYSGLFQWSCGSFFAAAANVGRMRKCVFKCDLNCLSSSI